MDMSNMSASCLSEFERWADYNAWVRDNFVNNFIRKKGGNHNKFCIFVTEFQNNKKYRLMITDYKITEIFCAVDEFSKNFDSELEKNLLSASGK